MRRLVLSLSLAILTACGGGSPTGPGGGGNGTDKVTASIDGQAFTGGTVLAVPVSTVPGSLGFQATQVVGSTARTIAVYLAFIPGPGTYPLGMNIGTSPGGTVSVTSGVSSFTTPLSGAAGSVTITSLTSTRVVGTFTFTATATTGSATTTVTNGVFDVPLSTGYVVPTADLAGSTMTATINGTPQVGATLSGIGGNSTTRVVGAMNLDYSISITVGPVTATGSGALTGFTVPTRRIMITRVGTAQSWGGVGNDTGTLTITTLTPTRIAGTFSGTLAPNAQTTGTMTVANGAFDVRTP
ncbi:MAG: hypothetical protein IPG05_07905 [Gemmatimonadetes bacterium]|nr:hypothetical protein [Gemmatimonadota bacterium]